MEYKIKHTETLIGCYYVEADTEEEALEKFDEMCWNDKIDLSDMEIIESSNVIA